ncbi:MAG: hypothetical protein O3A63_15070 [Proteobacteria bacterium]|nr:hypothetical protein [Pseudomonadota bacterium]
MTKTEQLQIRLSSEQKASIKAQAAQSGEDVSRWVLRRLLPPGALELEHLVEALSSPRTDRPLKLAAIHDFLERQTATDLKIAVGALNLSRLTPFEANYVAAMIETACSNKHVTPPEWLDDILVLPDPWFASNLKSLRLHLLTSSPPPFRRRNLFIDSTLGSRV